PASTLFPYTTLFRSEALHLPEVGLRVGHPRVQQPGVLGGEHRLDGDPAEGSEVRGGHRPTSTGVRSRRRGTGPPSSRVATGESGSGTPNCWQATRSSTGA